MSTIKVQQIQHTSSSTNAISLASDGTCTANITSINGGSIGTKNLIFNGGMEISQRDTSFNQPANAAYTLDRFAIFRNGVGIMDIEQSTTVPTGEGFKNSLKCTVDTADSSMGSADFGGLYYKIEGQDITQFEFGNSSAKQFTLSFYVRSNITGTYSVSFRNGSATRYLVKEYTINSADTWQKITITDTADLTGTWASDNTTGLQIMWCLWQGGYSGAPNSWQAGNIIGSTSNVNWVATVGNTFYLTGVQFEFGSVSTNFEFKSFNQELDLCKRYCQVIAKHNSHGNGHVYIGTGYSYGTSQPEIILRWEKEMRSTPSLVQGTGTNYFQFAISGQSANMTSWNAYQFSTLSGLLYSSATGLTNGRSYRGITNNVGAYLILSAEL